MKSVFQVGDVVESTHPFNRGKTGTVESIEVDYRGINIYNVKMHGKPEKNYMRYVSCFLKLYGLHSDFQDRIKDRLEWD